MTIRDYSRFFTSPGTITEEYAAQSRERYLENLYSEFVKPAIKSRGEELFQPWELEDDIRPPYTTREINDALEFAEDPEIELVEGELCLWRYSGAGNR